AQFQAMRSGPMARPVNLPQHLQQQQQQAQLGLEQQQAAQAQQQHQQQQHILAQQMAMQNAQQHGGNNNPGQQNQMSQQQMHNMQQAQIAAAQQQQQQQGQAASASQPSQPVQAQSQPQTQQAQPNAQGQPQQGQPQPPPQGMNPQQQAAAAAMMQQRQQQGEKLRGQCIMKLMQFADHLSSFGASSKPLQSYMANGTQKMAAQGNKQRDDLLYWSDFVNRFFSPKGVLRHSLWFTDDGANKQYEITYPALARYFFTHFESGVKTMQLIMEKGTEKDLPHSGHYIESQKSSFVYWFDTGAQLIANGTLRAHFDAEQKIELLEFVTNSHEEYLPRSRLIEAARPVHDWAKEWHKVNAPPEGKQSPEMNKKKAKAMKSPPQPPPDIDLPQSKVIARSGIPPAVFRFLELAEVIVQMNPLFNYSHQHPQLAPYPALEQYMTTVSTNGNNPGAQGQNPSGPRTPGMSNFPMGASPAAAHLQLPGSPHIGGSPAQAPGMQLQQSQHGTSSSGPSANTSPNVTNKRRRPSAVKVEEENQVNGTQAKPGVKPSPRINKRQKPNNAS
ncbi:Transcriptional activator, partial [Lachnellula willkommii]